MQIRILLFGLSWRPHTCLRFRLFDWLIANSSRGLSSVLFIEFDHCIYTVIWMATPVIRWRDTKKANGTEGVAKRGIFRWSAAFQSGENHWGCYGLSGERCNPPTRLKGLEPAVSTNTGQLLGTKSLWPPSVASFFCLSCSLVTYVNSLTIKHIPHIQMHIQVHIHRRQLQLYYIIK